MQLPCSSLSSIRSWYHDDRLHSFLAGCLPRKVGLKSSSFPFEVMEWFNLVRFGGSEAIIASESELEDRE